MEVRIWNHILFVIYIILFLYDIHNIKIFGYLVWEIDDVLWYQNVWLYTSYIIHENEGELIANDKANIWIFYLI